MFLYSASVSVSIRWKPGRSQFVPEQPSSTKNTGFGKWFFLAYSRRIAFWEGICIDGCPACVSCVPFTARSFVLFADLDEPQRFKNRMVLPRKVGRKEKDFVLYRPSLGGCVWMPDGSSELSGFQKRRRLKHTALCSSYTGL